MLKWLHCYMYHGGFYSFFHFCIFFFFILWLGFLNEWETTTQPAKEKNQIYFYFLRSLESRFILLFPLHFILLVDEELSKMNEKYVNEIKTGWLLEVQLSYDWLIFFVRPNDLQYVCCVLLYDLFIQMRSSRCVIALCCSVYLICFVCTVYVREYCIPVPVSRHRNKLTLTNCKSVSIRALFRFFFSELPTTTICFCYK